MGPSRHDAVCREPRRAKPLARHLGRLRRDVPRHVHGGSRYPGGRDLAADDPGRARHASRSDELAADELPHRRGRRHPAHGRAHARAWHAVAVGGLARHFHGGIGRLRLQPILCRASGMARRAGFRRRIAHTAGVCWRLRSLSRSWPGSRHDHRRRSCRACTHRGAVCGRLDHPDLRLALAVPHQPRAWSGCDCGVGMAVAEGADGAPPGAERWTIRRSLSWLPRSQV